MQENQNLGQQMGLVKKKSKSVSLFKVCELKDQAFLHTVQICQCVGAIFVN